MKKLVASDMSLAGIKKPPAGRPTNCEPSAAGRSWKGGARERADDVFFATGIKRRRSKADFVLDAGGTVKIDIFSRSDKTAAKRRTQTGAQR